MAKRKHRRHYRGLGDTVALQLGGLVDDLKGSVKGTDALIGAVIGVGGVGAFNWMSNQTWFPASLKTNATFMRFKPAIVGILAGTAAYFADKKLLKMPQHAAGHAVGAVGAGLAMQLVQEAKMQWPAYFSDIVDLRLAGLIVNDASYRRQLNGMIVSDPAPRHGFAGYADNPSLAGLANLAMIADDRDPDLEDMGLN